MKLFISFLTLAVTLAHPAFSQNWQVGLRGGISQWKMINRPYYNYYHSSTQSSDPSHSLCREMFIQRQKKKWAFDLSLNAGSRKDAFEGEYGHFGGGSYFKTNSRTRDYSANISAQYKLLGIRFPNGLFLKNFAGFGFSFMTEQVSSVTHTKDNFDGEEWVSSSQDQYNKVLIGINNLTSCQLTPAISISSLVNCSALPREYVYSFYASPEKNLHLSWRLGLGYSF